MITFFGEKMKNKEIINKEKGCSILECPICQQIKTSYSIADGVFQFWCIVCKKAYTGEIIVDWKEFALDDRFNEII